MNCHDCGTSLDVRAYGLCARCFRRWVKRTCAEHGVPMKCPSGDAAIAAVLDAQQLRETA